MHKALMYVMVNDIEKISIIEHNELIKLTSISIMTYWGGENFTTGRLTFRLLSLATLS